MNRLCRARQAIIFLSYASEFPSDLSMNTVYTVWQGLVLSYIFVTMVSVMQEFWAEVASRTEPHRSLTKIYDYLLSKISIAGGRSKGLQI